MNGRVLSVLVCALLVSAGASFMVYRLASGKSTGSATPRTMIVVATRDLEAGTLVHEADVKLAAWAGVVPKGSRTRKEDAINRGIAATVYEGEPVTENRLAPSGSGGGLAAMIPNGMRACAVKVNDVVGVAGFAIPGMSVDVLITGLPPGGSTVAGPAAKTLLQNIKVLSAGTNIGRDREGKPQEVQVVNLLVTPGQAEVLSLAGNETRIQLVLRNPMDTEVTAPPGTVMSELFGAAAVARTPARAPRAATSLDSPVTALPVAAKVEPVSPPHLETIVVLNGSKRAEAQFPEGQ